MGLAEATETAPPRMRIFNLRTNERFVLQFNPSQFSERLQVNYARPSVLGQSHQELQYLNTANLVIPMQFFFYSADQAAHAKGQDAKKFLHALCYPVSGADSIVGGAPPRALVVWPNVLSLTTKLTMLVTNNQRFNIKGELVQFTANVTFEEMRDVRWTSEDARILGLRRTGEVPGGGR